MPSPHPLDNPCRCGSGDTYRHCCATDSSLVSPELPTAFSAFTSRLAKTLKATWERFRRLARIDVVSLICRRLEIEPSSAGFIHGQQMLLISWLLSSRLEGVRITLDELIDQTVSITDDDADELLAVLDNARLGAWQLDDAKGELSAVPIDGQLDSEPLSITVALDARWTDVDPDAIYIGWVANLDGGAALLLAYKLSPPGTDAIRSAAARSSWSAEGPFRRRDYEEDLLAVTINDEIRDSGRTEGRIFLDPVVFEYLDQFRDEALRSVAWQVFHKIPFGLRHYCRSSDHLTAWTQRVATAVGDDHHRLLDQLREARDNAAYTVRSHPFAGRRTLGAVIEDSHLLNTVHLNEDGTVDHPATARRNLYPAAVLNLQPSWLRAQNINPDWAIIHAASRAQNHLDDKPRARLQEAINEHHIAMRWVGIIASHLEADDPVLPYVLFEDLHSGIQQLLPRWAGDTEVEKLPAPGQRTWSRIIDGMRQSEALPPDAPLRIRNLPSTIQQLESHPGVASGTSANIRQSLLDYVAHWPESAGYSPVYPDSAAAAEAHDDIRSSLDVLDDLF